MSNELIGVIVGAVLAGAFTYLPQFVNERRAANYLAIRVSICLDEYVDICAQAMYPPDPHDVPPDRDPMDCFTTPDTLKLPEDVDWRAIDSQLAYDILSLVGQTIEARKSVFFTWSACDGDGAFQDMCDRFSEIGIRASKLSATLRQEYRLKKPELNRDPLNDYNPFRKLKEKFDEREARRKSIWAICPQKTGEQKGSEHD